MRRYAWWWKISKPVGYIFSRISHPVASTSAPVVYVHCIYLYISFACVCLVLIPGTYLRAHPHHRTRWITKCGRMRRLDWAGGFDVRAGGPVMLSCAFEKKSLSVSCWSQDLGDQAQGEEVSWTKITSEIMKFRFYATSCSNFIHPWDVLSACVVWRIYRWKWLVNLTSQRIPSI